MQINAHVQAQPLNDDLGQYCVNVVPDDIPQNTEFGGPPPPRNAGSGSRRRSMLNLQSKQKEGPRAMTPEEVADRIGQLVNRNVIYDFAIDELKQCFSENRKLRST